MKKFLLFLILIFAGNSFTQNLSPDAKHALIHGSVTDFNKKPLKKDIILFVDTKTNKAITITTDEKGLFKVLVPVASKYSLKYKNFTVDMNYTEIEIPGDADATYQVEIEIDPPKNFTLENVLFESGKSSLKPASFKQLDQLAEFMKIKNTMVIELQGHTDNVGKPEDNLKLSQERAQAVVNYLVKKGIETGRLIAKGYGDTKPVADNNSEQGKAKNRRTCVAVIKE